MRKRVIVVGAGFSGLSVATALAHQGFDVTILEKNSSPGGRARSFSEDGFVFDMGPSWYWMPDVFDNYFATFGKKVADYYNLLRLDPSYAIFFGEKDILEVPASLRELHALFEQHEPGSSARLDTFLQEAEYKYQVGMKEFVYKPGLSPLEFADARVFRSLFRLQMFTSMASHVDQLFQHPHLRQLLKFPVLFLGATPENTPAMYSLMNYADLVLGTWYPQGGMYQIIRGMVTLAEELGVKLLTDQPVRRILTSGRVATEVVTERNRFDADVVVSSADYYHTDQALLTPATRNYSETYWNERVMAPSSLLFYLGVNKKLDNLLHHNLFFDEDFTRHAEEIYETPQWPSNPLFYVCCASKTDPDCAPPDHENVFVLIPVAPGLDDSPETRKHYYDLVMKRLEWLTGQSVRDAVVYQRSYAHRDFVADYNAFRGNAYGLANTLRQTAILKPSLKNKNVDNLYYTGQLTVPGPGVPPSLISGLVVAREIARRYQPNSHSIYESI